MTVIIYTIYKQPLSSSKLLSVAKISQELKMSRLAFVARYQRNKPSLSHKLIFYCKFGELSQSAAEEAVNIGYKK
jgi:hypothetical protein